MILNYSFLFYFMDLTLSTIVSPAPTLKWFFSDSFCMYSICWTMSISLARTMVITFAHYLFGCFGHWSCFLFHFLWLYNVKVSSLFQLSNIAVHYLWVSTCLAHANTCLLATILMSFMAVNSHVISISMSLSFRPWMNCSFNHLSTSL